jgi:hypothetical protein
MADVTISLAAIQVKALQRLDPVKTPKQVLVEHINTWLLPEVQKILTEDHTTVRQAYIAATPEQQAAVREVLGIG